MKRRVFSPIRSIILLSLILSGSAVSTVRAFDVSFYQGNDILFYNPEATGQCVINSGTSLGSGVVSTGNGANGNKDYKGRQIISDDQLTKIKKFQPAYEEASKKTKIPWQVFAVIHIRESNLADYNPPNDGGSQGIYQDYGWDFNDGKPYPDNGTTPVSDEEFLRQTINAGMELQDKIGSNSDLVEKGDPAAIKEMFFKYNGAASAYVKQAKDLGYDQGYEGSPYVMNIADEKRDPEVNKTTWGQIQVDNGPIAYPAGSDYGAFVMYAALAGIPANSGGGTCTGSGLGSRAGANGWPVTGPNAMVIYYQDEEPWASTMIGPYSIKGYGCGPTSTAMAVATLNNDKSVNPQNMAQFFYDNGSLQSDGTHFDIWPKVEEKYGVSITLIGTDLMKAAEALKRGSFVIISANGCPFACAGGHILLFRGMTDSGNFLVADPNKNWVERDETPYPDSNKTMYEEGFPVAYPYTDAVGPIPEGVPRGNNGINYMWEIRKK